MKPRIMYVEFKGDQLAGPARIGWVRFSKTGRSVYYRGKLLQRLGGQGFKANFFDPETGEEYWISGCKKRGGDTLYGGTVSIDEDAREEYWTSIREMPSRKAEASVSCLGKY